MKERTSVAVGGAKFLLYDKVAMFSLAALPILSYYIVFGPLLYSDIIAFLLLIVGVINKRIRVGSLYSMPFVLFWIYVAIKYLFTMSSFGLSSLFPGGISFCIFALIIGTYGACFNIELMRKYMIWIFLFASVLFLIQSGVYMLTGVRFSCFLPLGNHLNYADLTYEELRQIQMFKGDRFCSIFAEKSYLAQYGIYTLIVDLFWCKNKTKIITPLSLFIILIIILSRSGVGYISLVVVIVIKIIYFATTNRSSKYLLLLLLFIPVAFFAVQKFMLTDLGTEMIERAGELDSNAPSSGFARVIESSLIYSSFDATHKLFGVDNIFVMDLKENEVFINGLFNVLIAEGLIGMFFLVSFYLSGIINKPAEVAVWGIVYFVISAMEWTYLGPLMIISSSAILGVSNNTKKKTIEYENT